ncbi:MAG: ATP-binding protein [Saprospiraceae bacterium]
MPKESPSNPYPKKVDLNNCDKEPIHLIGKIQNHGILIVGEIDTQKITHSSENCDTLFNQKAKEIIDLSLSDLLSSPTIESLLNNLDSTNFNYLSFQINNIQVDACAHRVDGYFIIEFEPIEDQIDTAVQQLMLNKIVSTIGSINDSNTLNDYMANAIKSHVGYDRVMIYQFDAQWNGSVVAEAKEEHLEAWLGLNYPSTDIPVPARRLFYNEQTRIIKDVFAPTVNIISKSELDLNNELDLSRSEYRATSPIHIEYLINMKVGATLTMPIVSGKKVWGLIACHHYSPKSIPYKKRLSLKFFTKFFANQIQINKSDKLLNLIKSSSFIRGELINQIVKSWNIPNGLSQYKYTVNHLTDSEGAAICIGDNITFLGECPSGKETKSIIERIKLITNENIYYTHNLISDFPEAKSFKKVASGVLCIFISESRSDAILWFKPEITETVYWAGKPQAKSTEKNVRLSPRKSFEKWKQIQEGFSESWKENEIAVVQEFRKNVLNFVTQKYDEIKLLNKKLKKAYEELESFSYSVSHDLRAPLRGIDGFAQIIKEDYFESLDDFGKSSIETIIDSVKKMNILIDDILAYSELDQKRIQYQKFSIFNLFKEEIAIFSVNYPDAKATIKNTLPDIYGDQNVVRLLVRNLLENAFKYSSKESNSTIEIGVVQKDTFYVKDNGIGFDPKHSQQIFKVFNRLNNDQFRGSGIGLSIAKRVVERHNGKIWSESELGTGATFYFKLNLKNE